MRMFVGRQRRISNWNICTLLNADYELPLGKVADCNKFETTRVLSLLPPPLDHRATDDGGPETDDRPNVRLYQLLLFLVDE